MLKVRFCDVAVVQTVVLFPVIVQIPEPIVRVRIFELEEENIPVVIFLLLASKVPLVRVRVLALPKVRSSPNSHVPPTPFRMTGKSSVLPLVVIVFVPEVAANVVTPVPAFNVILVELAVII